MPLTLRTGFEVELLAPPGGDRRQLAEEIARRCAGTVETTFHTDSEPSLVPGMGHFWHLTQGFAVRDADGAPVCDLVDDITLTADLDREATARPGWFRVLSDDRRLLRLVDATTDPACSMEEVLAPVAALFDTDVQVLGPVRRVVDASGATVAMAAPLPGERQRPCEIVTPPLTTDHAARLEALLGPARDLGFTVPHEAAVHLHVDGAPFRSPHALANLVRLFGHWREPLRTMLGTNPACTKLAPLPPGLLDLVGTTGDWTDLQRAAAATGVGKHHDVNLTALLVDEPFRDTVEVRILPGAVHATEIAARAALVERLLARCLDRRPFPRPSSTDAATGVEELCGLVGGTGTRRTGPRRTGRPRRPRVRPSPVPAR